MPQPRIYVHQDFVPGSHLTLPDAASRHVAKVLRLAKGEQIRLFDGAGQECLASITLVAKGVVQVVVDAMLQEVKESPLWVHLGQGIARGERMDFVMQKAVELGVAAITPLFTERTEVKLSGERLQKRLAHWQAVVVHACEQCGRNVVPRVLPAMSLRQWWQHQAGGALIGDPTAEQPLSQVVLTSHQVKVAIGPEGGFSAVELQQAEQSGAMRFSLGPRVLRSETAGMVALSVLQSRWGDI